MTILRWVRVPEVSGSVRVLVGGSKSFTGTLPVKPLFAGSGDSEMAGTSGVGKKELGRDESDDLENGTSSWGSMGLWNVQLRNIS